MQYSAVWLNTDGNKHDLYPIYAKGEEEAKQQAVDFMFYRWGKRFVVLESLKVSQT